MGRVLVVDDEPVIRDICRRMLSGHHEVVAVGSAREGIEALDDAEHSFDAILCDLDMPAMDGVSFHEELLERAPDLATRIAFLTGGSHSARFESHIREGDHTTIQKPFQMAAFRDAVDDLVESA